MLYSKVFSKLNREGVFSSAPSLLTTKLVVVNPLLAVFVNCC